MLKNSREMLILAKSNNQAICHFNINNLEWTKYILECCQELKKNVILGVSSSAINYMGGPHTVVALVKGLITDLNITVDVVLHLDHGQNLDICKKCIDAGFTSVMIDGSNLSLEENIILTNQVIAYAHEYQVTVEGEIGKINATNSNIADVLKYINSTKVDSLAVGLGTVHGPYKEQPKLDFDTMQYLRDHVATPIVLHGCSGLSDHLIHKAVKMGINKININTELQMVWSQNVRNYLAKNSNVYDPRKIISAGELILKEKVRNYLNLLA